jgi:MFS transporter, AAHS family, 4-hydroxybenzoate transporter
MHGSTDKITSEHLQVSKVNVALLFLCFVVTLTDGFDTLSIAFTAPAISAEWHVASSALGALFSAGLLGGLIGALITPLLAAKGGYRIGLILCVIWFSAGTLLVREVTSVSELGLLRVFTGIGLGAAIPLLTSAATELFPKHFRSRAVSTMLIGMPLGGVVTGLTSALVIPQYGWRTVFLIGGIAPLFILPFLAFMMPRGVRYTMPKAKGLHAWRDLLKSERPLRTTLVAIACFLGMLIAYSLANWAPTLLRTLSPSFESAFISASLLNVATAVVMLFYGWFIDRFGLHNVTAIGYLGGAPFLVLLGFAHHLTLADLPLIFIGGLLILGTPVALPILAAETYPPHLRVEAVSGYVVMSRLGAVIGPFAAGMIIQYAGGMAGFMAMLAIASVVAGVAVLVLRRWNVKTVVARPMDLSVHSAPMLHREVQ